MIFLYFNIISNTSVVLPYCVQFILGIGWFSILNTANHRVPDTSTTLNIVWIFSAYYFARFTFLIWYFLHLAKVWWVIVYTTEIALPNSCLFFKCHIIFNHYIRCICASLKCTIHSTFLFKHMLALVIAMHHIFRHLVKFWIWITHIHIVSQITSTMYWLVQVHFFILFMLFYSIFKCRLLFFH